jgi:hypothetical protein
MMRSTGFKQKVVIKLRKLHLLCCRKWGKVEASLSIGHGRRKWCKEGLGWLGFVGRTWKIDEIINTGIMQRLKPAIFLCLWSFISLLVLLIFFISKRSLNCVGVSHEGKKRLPYYWSKCKIILSWHYFLPPFSQPLFSEAKQRRRENLNVTIILFQILLQTIVVCGGRKEEKNVCYF